MMATVSERIALRFECRPCRVALLIAAPEPTAYAELMDYQLRHRTCEAR